MVSADFVTWATIVGTWVLVVGTLAFAYWQLKQAQRLHSATTLLDLRERFYGGRMRQARRELATWLLSPDRGDDFDNWEVGIFFELMGFLTRTRVLERRAVWSAFGPWITAYYAYTTQPVDLIAGWRKEANDPLLFADFEWLAKAMSEIDRRSVAVPGPRPASLEDFRDALESETHLDERRAGLTSADD